MQVLFLSYCGSGGNSLPHITGFARELCARSEIRAVTIAVPGKKLELEEGERIKRDHDLAEVIGAGQLRLCGHGEALEEIAAGWCPEIIHLWTPREICRRWLVQVALRWPVPAGAKPWPTVLVHLEDNEESLAERHYGSRAAWESALRDPSAGSPQAGLSHPLQYPRLCTLAEGATVIWETLGEFVPGTTPTLELLPAIDLATFRPRGPDEALCRELGLTLQPRDAVSKSPEAGEIVVCYNGNTTTANFQDMVDLYTAIHQLRAEGWPLRLLRTGRDAAPLKEALGFDCGDWVTELGFVDRGELPRIYSLSHVFVQPGPPDEFNRYRLPSKLPEYLASGGLCLLPAVNLGLRLRDGQDAVLLQQGDREEIKWKLRATLEAPERWSAVRANARLVAEQMFAPAAAVGALCDFYVKCRENVTEGGATPAMALLSGFAKFDTSGERAPTPRDLATARAAAQMLALDLREYELPANLALRQEVRELRKAVTTGQRAQKQLEEIQTSRAWKWLARPFFKRPRAK